MPLLILGLIVIISIAFYWYVDNKSSDDPFDPRVIRGFFSKAAQAKTENVKRGIVKKIKKRAGIYEADYRVEDDGFGSGEESDGFDDNTIPFPSDVEKEKRRRDIH